MKQTRLINAAVIVAALGYFVDIYDLVLFSIVRMPSLRALGLTTEAQFSRGVMLLDLQMAGMLIGGIFWGILGDKKGRLSVLFGSITLYSLANIANGFVTTLDQYAALRFIAGIGLAGELGAGITLVSEVLPKESRGYGTMVVATVGVSGAILAGIVGENYDWRTAYIIGGVLGLALLALRVGVTESGMFATLKTESHSRGDFFMLFKSLPRFKRYLQSILIGVPIWFVIGIMVTFSPEIGKALGVTGAISTAKGILYCYLGLVFGDFTSGYLSQAFKSRKKIVMGFVLLTALSVALTLVSYGSSPELYYAFCGLMGFATGYWAVFVTVAAEQFGTNLRATVATTAPNFVRGSVVPMTLAFHSLSGHLGVLNSAWIVCTFVIMIALVSAIFLPETFGKELDYVES